MVARTFVSNASFDDAKFKAKMAGFNIVGQVRNKRGQFVVFGRSRF